MAGAQCAMAERLDQVRLARTGRAGDQNRRLFEADLATQMPDDLLLLTDKMSMAVSLECRVPLLDLTLVDLAARMPSSLKIRNGTLKYSLKRALEGVLPRDDVDGVYIGWVFEVLGHDLRHGSFGIASNLRLMKTAAARFGRATHERVDDRQMRVMRLEHKIRHADAKPLAEWFRKHVKYAEWEARHYVEGTDLQRGLEGFSLRTKAGRTVGVRWVYNKLPLFVRPFLHFSRSVVLLGAWRDGLPGLMYAGMQSLWYPLMIDLFIYEERWRRKLEREAGYAFANLAKQAIAVRELLPVERDADLARHAETPSDRKRAGRPLAGGASAYAARPGEASRAGALTAAGTLATRRPERRTRRTR